MKNGQNNEKAILRAWFFLTYHERLFLAGILVILLIGIVARYFHLKGENPNPYNPKGLEQVNPGEHS